MSIAPASTATQASSTANLTMQDFLKVLLTQLTYQDPLKPMDNQQFMAQIAQFTTLQQTQELNTNIQTLLSNQSALQSVGLLGRTVDVTSTMGPISGEVIGISLSGTSPLVTIRTTAGATLSNLDLSQVTAVRP